jgi:mRNA interferase MazF
MIRGDVVSVADRGGDFTGKPRPAVVVQSNFFDRLGNVTVCPLSSIAADLPLIRLQIEPSDDLRLDRTSWIIVDKITSVRRSRVGAVIGHISAADIQRLNGALAVFLGLG